MNGYKMLIAMLRIKNKPIWWSLENTNNNGSNQIKLRMVRNANIKTNNE